MLLFAKCVVCACVGLSPYHRSSSNGPATAVSLILRTAVAVNHVHCCCTHTHTQQERLEAPVTPRHYHSSLSLICHSCIRIIHVECSVERRNLLLTAVSTAAVLYTAVFTGIFTPSRRQTRKKRWEERGPGRLRGMRRTAAS